MQCKDAIEDNYTALFEEHQHHWFVDALLSSMSYEHFFAMMTKAAREGGEGIGGGGASHK